MIPRDYILFQFAILMLLKYYICEYILQTTEISSSKHKYFSIGSLKHICHHILGSLLILLFYNIKSILIPLLLLLETFLHYHIDYLHMHYGPTSYRDKKYWQWLGAEQFLHQLTIILMMILIVKFNPELDIPF